MSEGAWIGDGEDVLYTIQSPEIAASYPQLVNKALIPPNALKAMDRVWSAPVVRSATVTAIC
jgi:hypothetical protein